MKKLQVNMVFRNTKDNVDFRIILISYDYSDLVCIELNNKKSFPYYDNTSNVESQLINEELEILENDPYFKIYDESIFPSKFLKMRDTAYDYIKDLCCDNNLLDLCSKHKRGLLISDINTKLEISKTTIYKNMRKYLQGGMTKNSLLPPQLKSRVTNYSNKPGRKRNITQGEGIIIDDNILLHIKNIYEMYYLKIDGSTIKQTYHEFLYKYYSYLTIENGNEMRKILDDDKIPTLRQFKYHMDKIRNFKREILSKIGEIKYQQTERPTLSREDINVFGPGHLYEIDSTVSDIYLASNISRNIVVGRAVLYIIIDVYSRLITGFYAGLEESSWTAAMMAYMNMNENKVDYCKTYDIDIAEEEWPSYGIPSRINADRGETISKASDELVKHLHINIENNPPYCPDMKGIVERWFKTINDYLQKYVPGGVRKNHQQRGGEDYRKNAVLNIREFNQMLIRFILGYNNTVLQSFSMSKDMIDNQIVPTPSSIWDYGATMKLLFTSSIPKEKMMLTLMPKAKASIQRGGICFKRLYYSCETGIRENWFLRVSNAPKSVDIAYDPRNLNKIYIYDKRTMQFETCNMLPKSIKDYEDVSLDELIKIRSTESKLKKLNNTENISLQINSHHQMKDIIDNAVKQSTVLAPLSQDKTKNIPINKKIEKAIMRKEEYFDLDTQTQNSEASVLSLDKYKNKTSDNYEITYEEHAQKHNDEMNDLIKSIILGDKEDK
ncbi:transposase family protein [Clostridium estertheticum]|uniref:Mu transposase C-terminal domain-containing protein n=1 Tax=Clostridium estertheticum TaxID=238834 RepID=UPI001C0C9E6E|nr:Mu transposase C-terminal domain-containing protein [Clostridium estertheticum]MBU3175383.1 transposase family protein [Clostridium estertheticum]